MNNSFVIGTLFVLFVVLIAIFLVGFCIGVKTNSKKLKNIVDREIEESRGTDNGRFLGLCRASKIISDSLK